MKARSSWIALLVVLVSQPVHAGTVRDVAVNNGAMTPIYLRMGKSTVLRFVDKPKKVVVGNQNYYGLEFIDNDVAIQPLGSVATNLFVYTQNHTYGFLLTPGERYDDLVFVRWRYQLARGSDEARPTTTKIALVNITFNLGGDLRVTVNKIQPLARFGLYLIDCTLENMSKRELNTAGFGLSAVRSGQPLENQNLVVERDKLKAGEKTKARLALKIGSKTDFTLEGKLGGSTGKTLIGHKFL